MKILCLVDAVFEDMPGGSRVVAREMAHRLARRGHEVTLLAARLTPQALAVEERDGIRIVRYEGAGNPARFVWQGRQACAQLFAEQRFDVVHTHFAYAALGPLQAVPAAVPRLRFFHGAWDEEGWVEDRTHLKTLSASPGPTRRLLSLKSSLKRALRRRIEDHNLRQSRKVIVLSEYMRVEALARGLPEGDVCVIPGGTDVERFAPAGDRATVRQRLGLPPDRRLLLSIRRLAKRMGLDQLLRAMPAVVARHPEVLLLIGGQGPERESLEQIILDLRLSQYVRMLGFVPDEQLVQYYQAADLFVLPTVALEGFGLVTTEALACGLPVIGTPVGATPEILSRIDPRLISRGAAPQDLADAVLDFLGSEWAQALTRSRLRSYVLENYTWERHVSTVEKASLDMVKTSANQNLNC